MLQALRATLVVNKLGSSKEKTRVSWLVFVLGFTALTCPPVQLRIAPSSQAHSYDRQVNFALPGYCQARCGWHGSGL